MSDIQNKEVFLRLVRLGIGNQTPNAATYNIESSHINWDEIESLAEQQGLSAIIVDGIDQIPERIRPSKEFLLQWIGKILQEYEYRYELYRRTIAELAAWYNSHGYKMMLLKGYACSINWLKPEHRPCGDIDIWLFGNQKKADKDLENDKGIKIDSSHHHHTVFNWRDFSVENHFDFINVHHHKSNVEFERILKELGQDDSYSMEIYGEKVYLPSANLHALFLLKHMMMHFAAEGITLRQLLDWAFFVKKNHKEVEWKWLMNVLDQFGIRDLFNAFNAICVDDLGFEASVFHQVQFNPFIKERILNEILYPEFTVSVPKGFFRRIVFKFHRWRSNAWKHKLCYKDSMWSAFWSGVWNHILKPSSI